VSSPTGGETDADRIRSLIAGERTIDGLLEEIAWSDGWPVVDGDTWYFVAVGLEEPQIAGDFNGWLPEAMTAGEGFWWAERVIEEAKGQKYKFVFGDVWTADAWSRAYAYDDYGQVSFVAAPTDTGHLERWPGLAGAGLGPRDVRVYVPPGEGPFPVIYMHDGQNLFDPESLWGGWKLLETLPTLEPILVVGVDNTAARFEEYTHVPDDISGDGDVVGGDGDAYAELVHEVVRPHIEGHYVVSGKNGQLGASLGGLISLHIAERYPSDYDFAGSLSGTLGWGRLVLANETMQERWLATLPEVSVFVDSGGDAGLAGCEDPNGDGFFADDPDAQDNYCTTRQFADALAGAGFTWEQTLWHWHAPGEPHNEMAWAGRVARPLQIFLDL